MENKYNVRAIERALTLLECFSADCTHLSLPELSERMELNKSTVFRIAATLESHHYLELDEDGKYHLGFEAYRLGTAFCFDAELKRESLYYMNSLVNLTGESVILVKYEDYRGICISKVESQSALKIASMVGSEVCLIRGATGKVISSFLPNDEFYPCVKIQEIINDVKYDMDTLERDRQEIQRLGYSISNGELDVGVNALAAPIFDSMKQVVGSISIAGPSSRFIPEKNPLYIDNIVKFAQEISQKIGHPSH